MRSANMTLNFECHFLMLTRVSQIAVVFFGIYSSRSIKPELFIEIGAFRHFDDVIAIGPLFSFVTLFLPLTFII